ncbi:glycogen-binding domain-containing protein [Candidatus Bipolaricaulota bacterium]|nr:glycogen-binding domain-containing protein [Candidatus Bipolaricaulota bacterium]
MRFDYDRDEELIRAALSREVDRAAVRLEGLEGRVLRAIAAKGGTQVSLVRRFLRTLAPSRPALRLALALAGFLLTLGLGILLGGLVRPGEPVPALAKEGTVFALVAPEAHSVAVLGDFSGWQPIALSDPDGDGVWTLVLKLPPGRYEYAYLVDGHWVGQDPSADEYVRTFNQYTSVRYVGRRSRS